MTDDPRIDPADLRNVRFPGSSRRYDARSVDQFLETVATRIAATNVLVDELRAQVAEAAAAPAPAPAAAPAAEPSDLSLLADDDLVRLVGEETATVLSTARRAAEEIRSKAEESAARMIREATAEADRLTAEARERATELTADAEQAMERATAEAEEAAASIRAAATEEAEQVRAEGHAAAEAQQAELDARRAEVEAEAEQILADAREEGRGMVAEAKEVRTRILEDLQRRRDLARDQIERLLAGRERLLAAYGLVRENLDDITAQLADSLPDPGEPELPDGFVGIVGGAPADGDDPTDLADAVDDVPDDTVAPADDTVAPADEAAAGPDDTVAPDDRAEEPDDTVASEPSDPDEAIDPDGGAGHDEAVTPDETEVVADVGNGPDDRADGPTGEPAGGAAEPAPVEAVEDEPVEVAVEAADPIRDDEPVEAAAEEAPPGDVDALFARLRAEREQSVAKAQEVLAGPGADAAAPPAEHEPADVESAEVEAAEVEAAEVEAAEEVEAGGSGPADVDRVPPEFLADADVLARRAEALEPLEDALNRALKRRLADEQNELLDLLRRSSATDPGDLLPELDDQVLGYASIAERHLAAAAHAGAGGKGSDVTDLAESLGRTIVEPFHRRVERAAAEVDGDADELDERLRALYREWKVQHIAPAASDALLSAYALGTLHGAGDHGKVRWLIDPAQGPCPDAQDNALAGAVDAGEAFPTGDRCPQAHPGCGCILVSE